MNREPERGSNWNLELKLRTKNSRHNLKPRSRMKTVVSSGFSYFILLFFPLRTHEQFDILIDCADSGDAEGLNQHLGHIG